MEKGGIFCRGTKRLDVRPGAIGYTRMLYLSNEAADWLTGTHYDIRFTSTYLYIIPGTERKLAISGEKQRYFTVGASDEYAGFFNGERTYGKKILYKGQHGLKFGGNEK